MIKNRLVQLCILISFPVLLKAQSVVGGQNAQKGTYPWMANIVIDGSHACGGTLIGPTWVLTAGHCVTGTLSGIQIVVNDYQLGSVQDGEVLDVKNIFLHQSFDPFQINRGFDIALIELMTESSVTDFIDIPPQNDSTMAGNGATCKVLGWGIADTISFMFSDTLKEGDTKIMTYSTCNNASHYNGFLLNKNVVCASGDAHPVVTGSFGDSGGPLMVMKNGRWTQIGITSHGADGSKWGTIVAPAVYTKVSFYHNWIKTVSGITAGVDDETMTSQDIQLKLKNGDLHINGDQLSEGILGVQVIDMQGRILEDEKVYIADRTNTVLSVRDCKEGSIYAVRLKFRNGYKVIKLVNEL